MVATFKALNSGTLRTITRAWVKQAGVLRRLKTAKVMDGGSLRTVGIFADPLTATVSGSASGTASGFSAATITTSSVTALPSGGQGPYTYAWAYLSGDTATILSPTQATTAFQRSANPGETLEGTFRCTVTDAYGSTATADATATFSHEGF